MITLKICIKRCNKNSPHDVRWVNNMSRLFKIRYSATLKDNEDKLLVFFDLEVFLQEGWITFNGLVK